MEFELLLDCENRIRENPDCLVNLLKPYEECAIRENVLNIKGDGNPDDYIEDIYFF